MARRRFAHPPLRHLLMVLGTVLAAVFAGIAAAPAAPPPGKVTSAAAGKARAYSGGVAHPETPPASAVSVPAPVTTPPSTTPPTTAAPTTTTTVAPTTVPPTTAPPPPPPPAPSAQEVAEARFRTVVPSAWRNRLPVRIEIIPGTTSWGHTDLIQVAESHLRSQTVLDVTLAHEFGHVIAFEFGSARAHGAAPDGWPSATSHPAEHWADCVQQVLVDVVMPSHGLPPCGGAQLDWTRRYLATVPT